MLSKPNHLNTITPSIKNEFVQSANYIRAFAALAVTVYHLGGKNLPVLNYGWLGVQLFFVLSGFIICWSLPNGYNLSSIKNFILKRLIRIEPPYIFSIILALIMTHVYDPQYRIDTFNLFLHLGYLNNFFGEHYLNPVYWTLGVEFQFYLFIAVFFPLLKSAWGKYALLALTILCSSWQGQHATLIGYFPLFAMGIYTFLYKREKIEIGEFLTLVLIVTLCSIYLLGLLQTSVGLFASALLLANLPKHKIIDWFAKISFSLYLTHDIVGSNLVVFLGQSLSKTLINKAFIFSFSFAITILFAYLFYLLVEAPFLRYSKKIKYEVS